MCGSGRSSHVGGATLASLIRKKSALDTVHHRRTNAAASNLTNAEGIEHDDLQNLGDEVDVHRNDDNGQHHISHGHDGHQHRTDMSNAMNAAKHNSQRQSSNDGAHDELVPAEGLVHGMTDSVSLDGVVRESKGDGYKYGKETGHPLAV